MTREEAYKVDILTSSGFDTKIVIDKIYDDFESRTCDSCKYNKKQDNFMIFCDKETGQDCYKMMWHGFTKDFSCKYWESK